MVKQFTSDQGRLLTGEFGLERETMRVTLDGHMAQTSHPFPDDKNIVKDFCENQVEINTGVHTTVQGVIDELAAHTARLERELEKRDEALWLCSNPPYIRNADDIPVAVFEGELRAKHNYRLYLAEKYGKYKMTLSGIHVNYSLSEELLRQNFALSGHADFIGYKNEVYLRLAEGLLEYGWIINLLLSASPVCDGSYFSPENVGKTVVTRYASLRCGEEGYWNSFIPILDYGDLSSYADSIRHYIDSGALSAVSELYYPIRVKPIGANTLDNLVTNGVNHIEIRNVDIDPFSPQGIDARDLRFIELLILYLAARDGNRLSAREQENAIQNFKNAALFDIDAAVIRPADGSALSAREAGIGLLTAMQDHFAAIEKDGTSGYPIGETLDYQLKKLTVPGCRYAERALAAFSEDYVQTVLKDHIK